jgi:hypothetical protein
MKTSKLTILILSGCLLFSACAETKPEKPRPPVGSIARLDSGTGKTIGVTRLEYIDELSAIVSNKDKNALDKLVSIGKTYNNPFIILNLLK